MKSLILRSRGLRSVGRVITAARKSLVLMGVTLVSILPCAADPPSIAAIVSFQKQQDAPQARAIPDPAVGVDLDWFTGVEAFSTASSRKQAASAFLKSYTETLPDSVVKVEMAAIPAGSITIGTKKTAIKPFWIATTETTWEAFDVFLASGPPSPAYDQTPFAPDAIARPSKSYILPDLGWGHHGYPAINISNLSAQMFCRWLSSKTGKKYRLPTEAEWEYACRAGAAGTVKLTPAQLGKSAWYADNSDSRTHPVAKKLPNGWKLFDMDGNVGEWATDSDSKPVLCGGTFRDTAGQISPGTRKKQTPAWQETDPQLPKSRWWLSDGSFVGFRLIREP